MKTVYFTPEQIAYVNAWMEQVIKNIEGGDRD